MKLQEQAVQLRATDYRMKEMILPTNSGRDRSSQGNPEGAAMITNDAELSQALEQMERMYRALAVLRRDVYPINPQQFALLAEGPQDKLERFQQQIDDYRGRTDLMELLAHT